MLTRRYKCENDVKFRDHEHVARTLYIVHLLARVSESLLFKLETVFKNQIYTLFLVVMKVDTKQECLQVLGLLSHVSDQHKLQNKKAAEHMTVQC